MAVSLDTIAEEIEQLNVLELSQLVKKLEERLGVTAAAPVAYAAGPAPAAAGGDGAAAPAAEEQTEFTAMLTEVGANKINVIKVVREITQLCLKEAKVLIEQWRQHYNTVRPHSSLGYRPPAPQTFMPAPPHLDGTSAMQ